MVGENGIPETPDWVLPLDTSRLTEPTLSDTEPREDHLIRGEN